VHWIFYRSGKKFLVHLKKTLAEQTIAHR